MSNPITLGAASVRSELHEAPDSHDLTTAQAEHLEALSDDEIDDAVQSAADDYFWDAYYSVRRDAIARLARDHKDALDPLGNDLVPIVHLSGDDYEHAVDAANDNGGSTDAVVAYLAQWDYGEENDGAAEVNGHTQLAELERLPQQLHEVDHGGLHYWLGIAHGLRHYSLYRRPLS